MVVISKIASANLCKPVHDITNYSTSICPFVSGKCGKEGKKLQKFEYLQKEKSFFDEKKTLFIVFEGLSFGGKKNLIKIADTSFNVTSGRKDYLTASCIVLSSEEQALPSS